MVKVAIRKLREINWLYKDMNDTCIDDATKQVIETVDSTSSPMLVKATTEDMASFQSYTIRMLKEKHSTASDIDKLLAVKEKALYSHQKFLQ